MTEQLRTAITQAFNYLTTNSIDIPADIWYTVAQTGALKASGGSLASINAGYNDAINSALITYFEGGSIASSRNKFKQAMVEAFGAAFDLGYSDGGGEQPMPQEAGSWLGARMTQELGFIDGLFEQAKLLRKEGGDYFEWITARAEGYVATLYSIYQAGLMWAKKNKMLTWNLGATEKHCKTCATLEGKRHRASWYISHDYIPRKPGANLECGGYNCDCYFTDDKGNRIG